MKSHFKIILRACGLFLVLTVITGFIYPLIITGVAKVFFAKKAQGSLISKNGITIGSELIGQKFESAKYFSSRPSAIDYNPIPSGGTQWAQSSLQIQKAFLERTQKLQALNSTTTDVPQDLVFSSASGLDPHITPEAAMFQIQRIAQVRKLETSALRQLVEQMTEAPDWGILGEPRVNVLKLNLRLDDL